MALIEAKEVGKEKYEVSLKVKKSYTRSEMRQIIQTLDNSIS